MTVRTLVELKALKGGEESTRGSRKDMATNSSVWTLLRDIIDSFDSIVQTEIDSNMSIQEILEEVEEIETHLHSNERWMEEAAAAVGETHVADEIGTVGANGAFRIDAGNITWGNWLLISGSTDTPIDTGKVMFDFQEIVVEETERNETYFLQFAFGATAAAALLTDDYSEKVVHPLTNQVDSTPILIQSDQYVSGTKVWARCMCPGQNTAWIDFYPGYHEYDAVH